MKNPFSIKSKAETIAASAVLLLVLIGLIWTYMYYSVYAYVSIDVNPSLLFKVNRYDKVLSVEALNAGGNEIIDKVTTNRLKNIDIKKAVSLTVSQLADSGYLGEKDGAIVIATASDDSEKAEELANELKEDTTDSLGRNERAITVTANVVGVNRVAEAETLNVTPGKLNLVEKLIESAPEPESIDKEIWLDKTVKEIMTQTNTNKELIRNQNKEEHTNSGNENNQSNAETKDNKETKTETETKTNRSNK